MKTAQYRTTMKVRTHRSPTEGDRAKDPTLTPWSKVHSGYLSGDIIVEVDMEGLARTLGDTALRSKGKRAREAGGLVLVYARNVKREAV